MGFQNGWRGPNIVSDGLLQYLDPGSPNSYRQTSGFFDISGNNYNSSFVNGAAYSPSSQGVMILDGINDYLNLNSFGIPNNNGELTVNMWMNVPSQPTNIASLFGDGEQSQTVGYLWCYMNGGNTSMTYQYATSAGRTTINITNYMLNSYNTWVNFCIAVGYTNSTYAIYKNGSLFVSGGLAAGSSFPSINRSKFIGVYSSGALNPLQASIGPFMMYTKILTATEVLQNYNAQKSRFGL